MIGAEKDAIRVRRERKFESLFSNRFSISGQTGRRDEIREELSPSTCEEQHGSRSQALRLNKYEAFKTSVRSSSPRRVDRLPSRKRGPRITERQEGGWSAVFAASSELTQGEDGLISRTNFEC